MSQDVQRNASGEVTDAGLLNQSCFDLLLLELVPMAGRLSEEVHAKYIAAAKAKDKPQKLDEDELNDAVFYRLEGLGYRVGLGVVESLTAHLPLPSQTDPLDTIKYLCKDLWTSIFKKQIDNLKTNHRGVFVLTDNSFGPLRRCSLEAGRADEARRRAAPLLYFPAGLVRGLLNGLGIEASVVAEVAPVGLPGVVFQIRSQGAAK